ncbi:unnamed protein product [Psylliodes chrysocephalus]|uniref:Uncharacterized protein n=1 Tax=Psylliodes chrysocephalus TaxID=3402493 RepID=A0A9P0CSE8_9CUCU|nr:unnamed protein product [Psylliodes chrysocephala]
MLRNRGYKMIEIIIRKKQEQDLISDPDNNDSAVSTSSNRTTEFDYSGPGFEEVELEKLQPTKISSDVLISSPDNNLFIKKTIPVLEVVKDFFTSKKESEELNYVSYPVEMEQVQKDAMVNTTLYGIKRSKENQLEEPFSDVPISTSDDNSVAEKTFAVMEAVKLSTNRSEICINSGEKEFDHVEEENEPKSWSDDSIDDPSYDPPVRHHVVADDSPHESEVELNMTKSNNGRPRKGRKRKFLDQSRAEALKKFHGRAALVDQRGIKQDGKNKTSEEKVEEVINQINKIPTYISHYSRKKTDAKFLPPDVTLSKMYEMYSQEIENSVSITTYKKIFYSNFNLRTKTLKKDTCNICDSLKMQIDNEKIDEKKQELTEKHRKHIEEAENAQRLRREDFKIAKEQNEYERQLWVYNAGVHSGSENRGYCYVWAEGTAGRGAQEVGSCLVKHINENVSGEVKHLILWSDSYGGQNRNIKLTLILKYILHSSEHLTDITLKFLYSGHSFLPNDSDFSDIESALKHQQRMYLPSDYINVMKNCRKKQPFVVTEMLSKDFFGISNVEKNISNRKISVNGEKINWLTIRSIKITKDEPFLLYIQQNSFDDPIQEVNIKKLTRGRPTQNYSQENVFLNLVELWPQGKAIAEPNLANLREMYHLIPYDCLSFYQKLNGNANIEEDAEGYNIENLDFRIEED